MRLCVGLPLLPFLEPLPDASPLRLGVIFNTPAERTAQTRIRDSRTAPVQGNIRQVDVPGSSYNWLPTNRP
jgi:hypothetical protein